MADKTLKKKLRDTLKNACFNDPNDRIAVSDGLNGNIHLSIVSHRFDGLGLKEEQDLIWSVLLENLQPDEWGKISLSVGSSPTAIKAAAGTARR